MWVLAFKFRLLGLTDRRIFGVSILICILSHSSSSTPTRQYVGKTNSGTKRTEDLQGAKYLYTIFDDTFRKFNQNVECFIQGDLS